MMTLKAGLRALALGMALVGLCGYAPANAVTLALIDITRTSADPEAPTFSGSGLIGFDSPASSVADIDFFSLSIETIGSTFVGPERIAARRQFVYGLADIVAVSGLVQLSTLSGVIELAGKLSEDGGVKLDADMRLDFTNGVASGFCFGVASGQECIFGGGSSRRITANLNSTPVPGPIAGAGLPALMALGGFVWARRRKAAAAAAWHSIRTIYESPLGPAAAGFLMRAQRACNFA